MIKSKVLNGIPTAIYQLGIGIFDRYYRSDPNPPLDVDIGKIGYSFGEEMISKGFRYCSAVVLDFGTGAFLAHALPEDIGPKKFVDEGRVVDQLIEEAKERGFDPRKGRAFISAGTERSLEVITKDLTNKGICIKESNMYDGLPRDVSYKPSSNSLTIHQVV